MINLRGTFMRCCLCLLIVIVSITSLFAYNQRELEDLKNNPDWIIGIGKATTETKADKQAINDLLSQITVQVETSFSGILTEDNGSVSEYCSSAIDTYSSARLDAAERNIFEADGKYIVYRFMKKEDKNKVFHKRERLIKDYARRGDEAEKELRIGDALMNYYWSLVLLRTHPDWDKITETFNFQEESLITFLPDRIRRIYSLLDLKVKNKRYDAEDDLTLVNIIATYQNKPVRNLDLKYYLGADWSDPVGVSQGKALLEFMCNLEEVPDVVKINVMYNDPYKASHNADLRKVLENMSCPAFRESRFELTLSELAIKYSPQNKVILETIYKGLPTEQFTSLTESIIECISSKDINSMTNKLTENGKKSFEDIIIYGKAKVFEGKQKLYADKVNGKTYLRGLPVQFDFPNSGRKFNEELVFVINDNDKIEKVNFGLSKNAKKDILGKVCATETERFLIANFIEEYKTAYCTENIDFIEKIFDDNALIIVGQMLKEDNENIEGMYKKLGRNWRPIRYSKQQYIRNLKSVFADNDYVNLHFENNKVTRVNSDSTKVFGIQIHQYYYSQSYSDEGYLFLMFDLTNQAEPKIYVRTWQPEKNADGSVYGLEDFYLPNK